MSFFNMNIMKTYSQRLIFVAILFCILLPARLKAETLHQWEVLSLSFTTNKEYANPYLLVPVTGHDDLLHVEFEGISGEAKGKKITLVGFWNGGKEWRINFAPPYLGRWKYNSISKDKKLNGIIGSFEVIPWTEQEMEDNPTRHGFIQVKKTGVNAGHYFKYADGTPFLWIGDTWWNWTKKDIYFSSFKQLVDDRAKKGFNIGQLFIPGNGWGGKNSLLDSTYTELDVQNISRVEKLIKYANSKGITIWIHGWWGGKNLNTSIGAEKMERWWRYLVHRFCAYNVIWVLAGEYNLYNYGGLGLDFWNDLGRMVKQEDPYNRITSVHNTPPFWFGGKDAPQWSTASVLNNESWLDYNQCQVGHGKYPNEMIPQCVSYAYTLKPTKPIVVTEPWYEFKDGNPISKDIRFGAWSAILSGGAGHSYGGGNIWFAGVPESPEHENSGFPGQTGLTLNYKGALSISYLSSFFKWVKWWNLSPHPELIFDYPQPFCLATPGKEYVVYLRYGGDARVYLGKDAINKSVIYHWFDPSTGESGETKKVAGSEYLWFDCPNPKNLSNPENKDWVLYIKVQS
jgi:hypothetical protein